MIDPKYYGLVELILFGSIVLGLAFWQLWDLKKLEKARDAEKSDNDR